MKSERSVAAAVDVLRRTRTTDRVCVAAFATRRIAAVRRALGDGLCTAFGPGAIASLRLAGRARHRGARLHRDAGPARSAPHRRRPLRARSPPARLPVIAYTVDDPAEMRALLDLGVDGLMTDRADLLRDVLRERGQWP